MEQSKAERGVVLRIERSSVHDGQAIRTVVFLKGCPLNCWWCSTPESQSFEIEQADGKTYGQLMTVEEVMKEIRKDSAFYFHSGGGMTLSGGEILAQPAFARAILKASLEECIGTAVETTLFSTWENVSSILPYINTAFVDFKLTEDELHKKYCGGSNRQIRENLLRTNEAKYPFELIVRTPTGGNRTVLQRASPPDPRPAASLSPPGYRYVQKIGENLSASGTEISFTGAYA